MTTVGLHDIVLDICRDMANQDNLYKHLHCKLISSYYPEADEALNISDQEMVDHAMKDFRQWWLNVDDDQFIFENVVSLLFTVSKFEDVIWLVNKPKWIQKQIQANQLFHIRSDMKTSIRCIERVGSWNDMMKSKMKRWIKIVESALINSYTAILASDWEGMIWTQLYGRLQYFEGDDEISDHFLTDVKTNATMPSLKPGHGMLPPPSIMKDIYTFPIGWEYCCHVEDCNTFTILLKNTTKLISSKFRTVLYEYRIGERTRSNEIGIEGRYISHLIIGDELLILSDTIVYPRNVTNLNDFQVQYILRLYKYVLDRSPPDRLECLHRFDVSEEVIFGKLVNESQLLVYIFLSGGVNPTSNSLKRDRFMVYEEIQGQWKKQHDQELSIKIFEHNTLSVSKTNQCLVTLTGIMNNKASVFYRVGSDWDFFKLNPRITGSGDEAANIDGFITCLNVSSSGIYVALGANDGIAYVWYRRERVWKYDVLLIGQPGKKITWISIAPHGCEVITLDEIGVIRVWKNDRDDRWLFNRLSPSSSTFYGRNVNSTHVSNLGDIIIHGSSTSEIHIWEKIMGQWSHNVLTGHTSAVDFVSSVDNGNTVLSASADGTFRIWEKHLNSWGYQFSQSEVHTAKLSRFVVTRDGSTAFSLSTDHTLRMWKQSGGGWNSQEMSRVPTSCISAMDVTRDGSKLTAWKNSSQNIFVATQKHGPSWEVEEFSDNKSNLRSIAISPNGSGVASGYEDGSIQVWEEGQETWEQSTFLAHISAVCFLSWSRSGNAFVSATKDLNVSVWRKSQESWKSTRLQFDRDSNSIYLTCISMSANGDFVAAGTSNGLIYIWKEESLTIQSVLVGHTRATYHLTFHECNETILSSGKYERLIWVQNSAAEYEKRNTVLAVNDFEIDHDGRESSVLETPNEYSRKLTDAMLLLLQDNRYFRVSNGYAVILDHEPYLAFLVLDIP